MRPQGRTAELPKLISASFVDIMSTTEAKFINSGWNPQKNKTLLLLQISAWGLRRRHEAEINFGQN